jgi:hypothetical protein
MAGLVAAAWAPFDKLRERDVPGTLRPVTEPVEVPEEFQAHLRRSLSLSKCRGTQAAFCLYAHSTPVTEPAEVRTRNPSTSSGTETLRIHLHRSLSLSKC